MHNVFANMWQIAAKSWMNKSIARFPDVCLSPPSPPAGPIPIPYPNTSFSTDLKKGTKTVKVGGKPAAQAQKSFYKPLGPGKRGRHPQLRGERRDPPDHRQDGLSGLLIRRDLRGQEGLSPYRHHNV